MKRALIFLFLLIAVFSLSYTIRKGDVLRIEVVGYPDLTRSCAVDIEGAITFPYVGRVKVEGLSVDQVTDLLKERLSRSFSEPEVIVSLQQIAPRNVYVSGVVNRVVNMGIEDLSVSELLSLLSVDLSSVDLSKVKVLRDGKVFELDLSSLLWGEAPEKDVMLQENDQVILPEKSYTEFVKIVGAVSKPGIYPYRREMTLLDAVAAAGGTTQESSGKIIVLSKDETVEVSEKDIYQKNLLLKPGDTVHVQKIDERFAYVVGAVARPGMYTFSREESLTLKNLIAKAGGVSVDKRFIEKALITRGGETLEYDPDVLDENVEIEVGDVVEIKKFEKTEVYVSGYVSRPGVYEISPKENVTLEKLLSMAGGIKGTLEEVDSIVVTRDGSVITLSPNNLDFSVKPGDVVNVKEFVPKKAYVLGYVRNPGLYTFGKNEAFTLRNLIAKAGGFVDEGQVVSVKVAGKEYSPDEIVKEDILLEDGVFVYVERYTDRFVYMVGDNVSRNGKMSFEKEEPFTLSTALKKYGIEDFSLIKSLSLLRNGREMTFDPEKILTEDVPLEKGDTILVRTVQTKRVYFTGDVYGYVDFAKDEDITLEKALARFGKVQRKYIAGLKVIMDGRVQKFDELVDVPLEDGAVVELNLKESIRVYVDGFVRAPQMVVFEPDETPVLDRAIVKAGGYREDTLFEAGNITVLRDGHEITVPKEQTSSFELEDGDLVFVKYREKTHVYVFGEGITNTLVTFEDEETPTLRSVLGKVGGVKSTGSERIVVVKPDGEKEEVDYEEVIKTGGPVLESGSVVFVPLETENFAYVVGEVARPGAYELKGDVTLLKLIAQAGGLSNWALRTKVILRRGEKEFTYDFTSIEEVQNVKVEPGDVVYVPPVETNYVYVLGNVKNPGIVKVDRYSTVFDVVMRAGGFTEKAAASRIFLFRGGPQGEVTVCDLSGVLSGKGGGVNLNVSPGDVVFVPDNPLIQVTEALSIVNTIFSTIRNVKDVMGW
ncbi:sugar transporter [Thermotoga maritima MSB8]|uniref:Polysaccharide export protein, putative n=1 Tax=Thermotoga maritima (strain ATCC 43589 / DSM 3109 / JCM 10099 / NBRC 100826 / MSB8) TaxID=243274 RepID=Q9WZA6_THEMA|nr:SLBB domain-containing protein [Thermotoga maritima]AAD35722.1 polysaccharide export protein, putative [Thermotoga maritima MSB8]AGL49564.1 Capsule polysaccharide export protein [Thermotoga maritima MSB8]AHD17607.1 sugar transporter [Thermotoga maritima MSB8]AKE26561.1 sugar transporter [Thermotoga maritima]AKE28426.1 sugar transporter [Thermotoga maritima MSB8]